MEEIWIMPITNPYRKSHEKSKMLLSVKVFNLKLYGQYELHQKEKYSCLRALVLLFFQPPICLL